MQVQNTGSGYREREGEREREKLRISVVNRLSWHLPRLIINDVCTFKYVERYVLLKRQDPHRTSTCLLLAEWQKAAFQGLPTDVKVLHTYKPQDVLPCCCDCGHKCVSKHTLEL